MPGELSNCIAGRVANLFNFHGPNYVIDAACASALAAISAAARGARPGEYDAVADRRHRPQHGRVLVRQVLQDRRAVGHRYPPLRRRRRRLRDGRGRRRVPAQAAGRRRTRTATRSTPSSAASAAPATARARASPRPTRSASAGRPARAGRTPALSPATATWSKVTAPRPGSATWSRCRAWQRVFGAAGVAPGTIALGSVKSNIGHLKAAAGAAGLLKTVAGAARQDPAAQPQLRPAQPQHRLCALAVRRQHRAASVGDAGGGRAPRRRQRLRLRRHQLPRRARGVRARPPGDGESSAARARAPARADGRAAAVLPRRRCAARWSSAQPSEAGSPNGCASLRAEAAAGRAPAPEPSGRSGPARSRSGWPSTTATPRSWPTRRPRRSKALAAGNPASGRRCGRGHLPRPRPAPKVAFLYTGQGSQYANMLQHAVRRAEPIVAETFDEADRVMTPLLGQPLTDYHLRRPRRPGAVAQAEERPAADRDHPAGGARRRHRAHALLAAYGIAPTW